MSSSPQTHTIMVVEDDRDILSLITELLETEGYKVVSASNGYDGLTLLKEMNPKPSLVLLDLMMPKMDGYTFREEQKKDPEIAHVPVIIMSADGHVSDKIKATGAVTYLRKPFSKLESLLDPIAQYLADKKA